MKSFVIVRNNSIKRLVSSSNITSLKMFLNNYDEYKNDPSDSRSKLERLLLKCEVLRKDPLMLVYNEINDIKNQVQFKKELVENENEKAKNDGDLLLAELEHYENECRVYLNTFEFDKNRNDLIENVENQLMCGLKFLDICTSSAEKESIHLANNQYIRIIQEKIGIFIKNELFLNKLDLYKDKNTFFYKS
jgi:hypothetical protein